MHQFKLKIYYEDTDAGGVVYYANYLRYMERARTEFLREHGIDVAEYHGKGYVFAVVNVDIYYKKPAKLGETIEIVTEIAEMTNVTIILNQTVFTNDVLIAKAKVKLACLNEKGKPQRLPEAFSKLHYS